MTFNKGDAVWIVISGKEAAATILDSDPNQGFKLELEIPNPFKPEQVMKHKYTKWVPYHKLRERKVNT